MPTNPKAVSLGIQEVVTVQSDNETPDIDAAGNALALDIVSAKNPISGDVESVALNGDLSAYRGTRVVSVFGDNHQLADGGLVWLTPCTTPYDNVGADKISQWLNGGEDETPDLSAAASFNPPEGNPSKQGNNDALYGDSPNAAAFISGWFPEAWRDEIMTMTRRPCMFYGLYGGAEIWWPDTNVVIGPKGLEGQWSSSSYGRPKGSDYPMPIYRNEDGQHRWELEVLSMYAEASQSPIVRLVAERRAAQFDGWPGISEPAVNDNDLFPFPWRAHQRQGGWHLRSVAAAWHFGGIAPPPGLLETLAAQAAIAPGGKVWGMVMPPNDFHLPEPQVNTWGTAIGVGAFARAFDVDLPMPPIVTRVYRAGGWVTEETSMRDVFRIWMLALKQARIGVGSYVEDVSIVSDATRHGPTPGASDMTYLHPFIVDGLVKLARHFPNEADWALEDARAIMDRSRESGWVKTLADEVRLFGVEALATIV